MGWFALASVLGFLLHSSWHIQGGRRWFVWTVGAATTLLLVGTLGIDLWSVLSEAAFDWHALWIELTLIVAALGDGAVARAIFGGVLGFGLGLAIDRGIFTRPFAAPLRRAYLAIGLGLVILGVIAPHIDRWLARLTEFKSEIIEFRL